MITVTIEKRYGPATTVKVKVTAPSIEEAIERFGPGARVVFPIDAETFFEKLDPAATPAPEYAGFRQLEAVAS